MDYNLGGLTVSLNVKDEEFQEYSFVEIITAQDAMTDSILGLPKEVKWLILISCWAVLLVGSCFRNILYTYLCRKYNNKEFTPINTLILANAMIEHVTVVVFALAYTILIVADTPLKNVVGPWFCYPVNLLLRFGLYYSITGTLGISIYRILLIKCNIWLKYNVGENNMLFVILFGGIFLGVLFVLLGSSSDYEALFLHTCTIRQPEKSLILDLLNIYEQSRGNPSIYRYWLNTRVFIGISLMLMTVGKIVIYAMFFHEIYRHDNKKSLQYLLGTKAIKNRNRDNAFTFLGQFCTFVFNLLFLAFITLAFQMSLKKNTYLEMSMIIGGLGFTGASMLEALTTPPLRRILFENYTLN